MDSQMYLARGECWGLESYLRSVASPCAVTCCSPVSLRAIISPHNAEAHQAHEGCGLRIMRDRERVEAAAVPMHAVHLHLWKIIPVEILGMG